MKYTVRAQLSVFWSAKREVHWNVWVPQCPECDHLCFDEDNKLCLVGTSVSRQKEESAVLDAIYEKIKVPGFKRDGIDLVGPVSAMELLPPERKQLDKYEELQMEAYNASVVAYNAQKRAEKLAGEMENTPFRTEEIEL